MRLRRCSSLIVAALLFSGCSGKKDVTNDPRYDFSDVIGTWKTKSPLWLKDSPETTLEPGGLYLDTTARDNNDPILTMVPAGTQIRIEHLMNDWTFNRDVLYAAGSLVSGPHAGKAIRLDKRLFSDRQTSVSKWKVAPEKLEK